MNWDLKDEEKGTGISITFFNNPILSCSSLTIILNFLRGLKKTLIKMLIYVYIHTHKTFLSVDIGCFHILAIVSNIVKTIQLFLQYNTIQYNIIVVPLGQEYAKAVYCHPVYLAYMQSTSYKMPGCMKYKLESRLPGEIKISSDMQMTPPLWQKVKRN